MKTVADRRDPHVGDSEEKRGGGWLSRPRALAWARPRRRRPAGREGRAGRTHWAVKKTGPRAERE